MTMIESHDRGILRDLARQVAEIAARPEMDSRRQHWSAHNSLRSHAPMLWISPEGAWIELLPEESLTCRGAHARGIERSLRQRIYAFEHFQDDGVVEAEWIVPAGSGWEPEHTGWGLEPVRVESSEARGAFRIEPVLRGPEDVKKLRYPELVYDEKDHDLRLARAQDLFGDILEVKRKGSVTVSYHLWAQYIYLRGETDYLTDFVDRPEMVHEVMRFFTDGHKRLLAQLVERNLLSLNNDNSYHSSGGNGYTDELPAPGFDPARVRPCDIWASAESQELAGVSPRMHREFALQYERELLEPFGLNGYGCCEDLTRKLEDVLALPNMRRVSISPFANVDRCAEIMKDRAIFSWKPQPAHLTGAFQAEAIRAYLRHTIDVCQANHCVLEIILKDTHTCEHRPERFDEWTRICREEIQAAGEVRV
jgi:hypothetical protein